MDDNMVESNQAGARMGNSMPSEGYVSGDGYADVIVGAHRHNSRSGPAFVNYGNGGITGKPVLARQWTGDGAQSVPRVSLSRVNSRNQQILTHE